MSATQMIYAGRYSALSNLNRVLRGAKYADAKFFIFLDENSYNNCMPLLINRVTAFENAEFMEVPVGEEAKTLEIAGQLWGALLESGADRNAVIVNLGGGCVSDLGGFVAAGYKRGIRTINIPTTLVGMVDAAIGGKTAINVEGSKNQVGFFHQPEVVCVESAFLDTLPDKEMKAGLFELLKTLALSNPMMYKALLKDIQSGNVGISDELLRECGCFKSAVVKQDPNDHGIRKMLNLGHTFGHAIEAYAMDRGGDMAHGEAVGLGMCCAMYLSCKLLGFSEEDYRDWCEAVRSLTKMPKYTLKDTEALLALMRQDKKNEGGEIICVLLQEIGCPVIDFSVEENLVREALLTLS